MSRFYIPIKNGKKKLTDFSEIKNIGDNALLGLFRGCKSLTGYVSFPELITVGTSGLQICFFSSSLKGSVSFPKLTIISKKGLYETFGSCVYLNGFVSFPKLTTISEGGMEYSFSGCSSLIGPILFPELTTVNKDSMRQCFYECESLAGDISFPKLTNMTSAAQCMYRCFSFCKKITSISFPALTSTSFGSYKNQFQQMLYAVKKCTVHFPSNLQSVIGSWPDVTAGFGGTNTTVLFDLPATT